MTNANTRKSSADIERELDAERGRLEAHIGELRDRLTPGQLVDEALSYTRDGGAAFAGNLGRQVTANPLPATLLGVGLAWLIASNVTGGRTDRPMATGYPGDWDEADPLSTDDAYPYAEVSGGLKRVRHAADESGQWWSEFKSDTGTSYKAASDAAGRRAGHFVDETGKTFAGFVDAAGNRIGQFRDESGNRLNDTLGWASHSWRAVRDRIGRQVRGMAGAAAQMGDAMTSGSRQLQGMTDSARLQGGQLGRQAMDLLERQPLIAGALAFAAGAALGATLPRTEQEDQLVGSQADELKRRAGEAAGDLYVQGKEQAARLYEDATDRAGEIYTEAKDRIAETAARPPGAGNVN